MICAVDYAQAMPRFDNPLHVWKTMRALKTIAVQTRVPIIMLSQLLRRADRRRGGAPRLSDIRFSKLIVSFASEVWMLWQDPRTASETMVKAVLQRKVAY